MSADRFPLDVMVNEPLTLASEDGHEMSVCVGAVLTVLHVEPADPSVGIRSNTVTFVDPTDIGNELYANGVEFDYQEWDDESDEPYVVLGDVSVLGTEMM